MTLRMCLNGFGGDDDDDMSKYLGLFWLRKFKL